MADYINRPNILVFIILLLFTQTPTPAIWDSWTGTTNQAIVIPADGYMTFDDDAPLTVESEQITFVTLKNGTHADRADWDKAMAACAANGFSVAECNMSVGDGEF